MSSLIPSLTSNTSINVVDFGAVGDGVTDDTTPIADADAKAVSTGSKLIFPAGEYKISSDITIDSTCVMDEGAVLSIDNTFTVTLSKTPEAGAYQIFAGAGDFTHNYNEYSLLDWWYPGTGTYYSAFVRGILEGANIGLVQTEYDLTGITSAAGDFDTYTGAINIKSLNSVRSILSGTAASSSRIPIGAATSIDIQHVHFDDWYDAIHFGRVVNNNITTVNISDCKVTNTTNKFIFCASFYTFNEVSVERLTIKDNDTTAQIYFEGVAANVEVSGNWLHDNISTNLGRGIEIGDGSNYVDSTIQELTTNIIVSNNTIENLDSIITSPDSTRAITITGENITITGNTVRNITHQDATVGARGIYAKGINVTITGNTVVDAGTDGADTNTGMILCKGKHVDDTFYPKTKNLLISNNVCRAVNNVCSVGIATFSNDAIISNNIISGMTYAGINCTGPSNLSLYNLSIQGNTILDTQENYVIRVFNTDDVSNVSICNNNIRGYAKTLTTGTSSGIYLQTTLTSTTDNLRINNNYIDADSSTATPTSIYGISCLTTSGDNTNLECIGNTILDSSGTATSRGINVQQQSTGQFVNPIFRNNKITMATPFYAGVGSSFIGRDWVVNAVFEGNRGLDNLLIDQLYLNLDSASRKTTLTLNFAQIDGSVGTTVIGHCPSGTVVIAKTLYSVSSALASATTTATLAIQAGGTGAGNNLIASAQIDDAKFLNTGTGMHYGEQDGTPAAMDRDYSFTRDISMIIGVEEITAGYMVIEVEFIKLA